MKIETEKIVLRKMVEVFCRAKHNSSGPLCPECEGLLAYAFTRLDHCPKGDSKGSCRRCAIHCYAPAQRQQMRILMRYSGPRMLPRYPLLSLRHLFSK